MPYTIFINTMCDGTTPIIHDGHSRVIVFSDRKEAAKELADSMIIQYQQVLEGERDIDEVSNDEWVDEIEVDGFGRLKGWDDGYIFDSASYEAVRAITDELPRVSCWEDHADLDTPYDIHELCELEGRYVNIITRYAKKPRETDDVVGWAIEQHDPEGPDTDEVEILDAGVLLAFVDWLRAR
jgi:hypothetical protein